MVVLTVVSAQFESEAVHREKGRGVARMPVVIADGGREGQEDS